MPKSRTIDLQEAALTLLLLEKKYEEDRLAILSEASQFELLDIVSRNGSLWEVIGFKGMSSCGEVVLWLRPLSLEKEGRYFALESECTFAEN